ncbi:FAD binding domain protein [Xylariomycetidae sp. FL2044]|nr:FAD binding domain protein [Xylariomycetidae sp. FL2044]
MAKPVVIVGGSLSGLMHGIQLKRLGHNVTILEQDTASERSSQDAGISFSSNLNEFLDKLDLSGRVNSISCAELRFTYHKRPNFLVFKKKYSLSSWGLVYRVLRVNFDDGYRSTACPDPPPPLRGDGHAEYMFGKRVTSLQYHHQGFVELGFTDVTTGKSSSIEADLVLGADGIHSTMQKLLHAPITKQYAGYITWRGTVPEKDVSSDVIDFFRDCLAYQVLTRSYIVCYIIPTDDGNLEPGKRLINWVWYYNLKDGSPEMAEIFTDINGKTHRNSIPKRQMNPAVWQRARDSVLPDLAAPFAALLTRSDTPWATKVNDALGTVSSFHDGHVMLVGDAFSTSRPHLGTGTEQGAWQSLAMGRLMKGEITLKEWEMGAATNAKRWWLISRFIGEFGLNSPIAYLWALFLYVKFIIICRLGWN